MIPEENKILQLSLILKKKSAKCFIFQGFIFCTCFRPKNWMMTLDFWRLSFFKCANTYVMILSLAYPYHFIPNNFWFKWWTNKNHPISDVPYYLAFSVPNFVSFLTFSLSGNYFFILFCFFRIVFWLLEFLFDFQTKILFFWLFVYIAIVICYHSLRLVICWCDWTSGPP